MAATDLVVEMQKRNNAEQLAAHARDRRARRRTILVSIAIVVIAVLLAVVGKLAFDAYRVQRAISTAHAQVAEGTPEALLIAVSSLERGLELEPEHPEGLATLALIRSQQAIDGDLPLDSADDAIANAGDSPEATVAGGIVAVLRGDFEGAAPALAEIDPNAPNATALQRASAWVQAQTAVHDLDDPSTLAPAIATMEALAEMPGWARTHRVTAALYFRVGRTADALELLVQSHQARPVDAGLWIDEALYQAVLQRDLDEVETLATQLLIASDPPLDERNASRAELARAMAQLYRDRDDAARSALAKAYEGLMAGDHHARALALEVALRAGATALAKRWVDDGKLPPTSARIHEAWVEYVEDDVASSLEHLAALPQDHPRVALVQGLALVEQGRFTEARTWLGRAQEFFPHRPLLEVAMARVQSELGDTPEAVDWLEKISGSYPKTGHVWTGLAEALSRVADDDTIPASAEPALLRALELEPVPAHAAYMLGRRHQALAATEPKKVPEALAMLRKAVKLRDWVPRYRQTLGLYLADVGDRDEARQLLKSVADTPDVTPTTLLMLAELTAEHAAAHQQVPPSEVATWLARAAQAGVPPASLVRTNARIALTAGTPEGLAQARAWIEPHLQSNRKDLEARLIHVEALRLAGDIEGARASLRTGMKKTRRNHQGRLLLASGRVENDAGKERRAASLAYQGWRSVVKEPEVTANELLRLAQQGVDQWRALDNGSGSRSIGRGLTRQVPYRAESWVLRSNAQRDADFPEEACASAAKALSLNDALLEAHLALAECKLDLRDHDAARAAFESAAALATDEAEAKALRRRARKLR